MSQIFLKKHQTGELVEGNLMVLDSAGVSAAGKSWADYLTNVGASPSRDAGEQHLHWDWNQKATDYGSLLSYKFYGVECQSRVQGLMLVLMDAFAQLPEQRGKPMVYVRYVSAAPWNQAHIAKNPEFGLVGSVLVATAIALSRQLKFSGRIGLHSLPQSEGFYRDACGMQDLGPHPTARDLRYFEMTPENAESFYPS